MVEINKDSWKNKGKTFNIDNIEQFDDINFIDKYVQQWQKDTDDMYYKFLTENGYKIDKPYNIEQIKQIREDLEKQDKFIDTIEWIETKNNEDNYNITRHIIPFFNSISNPLSEESKQFILDNWKEKNK